MVFPLSMLTMSVLGFSINGFAKNIAQDIALDAARYAALADQDASSASMRAYRGLGSLLGGIFEPDVRVTRDDSGQNCSYVVNVTIQPVILGIFSSIAPIRESARAVCELQG